ncbi:MAG: CPBP family intramembrane metalloprotease [Candidatus Lokiarchaeota archaeon]|nr:CPBP family intramembrane metalloprotease [Candidatus Lokiarchaeota archaeon]
MSTTEDFSSKNLILFYIITYIFSWAFWVPQAMHSQGLIPTSPFTDFLASPFNVAAFGPLVGAIIVTLAFEGKSSTVVLLKRGAKWNFSAKWWIVIFFLLPIIAIIALSYASFFGGYTPSFEWLSFPFALVIAFVFIFFLGGPLQEEFGWRGYALPRLQSKLDSITSSIIVGLFWGLWHLPLFFIPSQVIYYNQPIWGLMISTILLSILFTWVFNNTKGSVLATLFFHTTFNWSHYAFPVLGSEVGATMYLILEFALALMISVYYFYNRRKNQE